METDNYRKSTIYCQVKKINAVYRHQASMMWRQLWDLNLCQKLSEMYSECFWPQDEMVWVIRMSCVMSHKIRATVAYMGLWGVYAIFL